MCRASFYYSFVLLLVQKNLAEDRNPILVRKPRIVGGSDAIRGEFPHQGLLLFTRGEEETVCGCSLLNSQWVITAAHCTFDALATELRVYFGDVVIEYLRNDSNSHSVSQIHQHEFFNVSSLAVRNDISLLKIDGEVNFSKYVASISLPNEGEAVQPSQLCNITGWGEPFENGSLASVLQKAQVPVLNNSYCRELYSEVGYEVFPREMCAGFAQGGVDACFGDSGGPLACMSSSGTPVLQGIVSFGEGCGRPSEPTVYTRVASYVSWIQETMENDATILIDTTNNYHVFSSIAAFVIAAYVQ